jgi:eukaryotic-like serine/threonine-protein kinase
MNPAEHPLSDRWTAITELFSRAAELSADMRQSFLETECGDADIRAEVSRLLTLSESAERYFEGLKAPTASGAPQLEAGYLLSHRFRMTRFIARGGMGEVYEAEDLELGGRVALKTMKASLALREGSLQRFREEIRLARSINSVNVCRVYDVARGMNAHGGEFVYFTMELLDGETLLERLAERGPLGLQEIAAIVTQMTAGLDAAHRIGILHRDLKGGNVMLCREGGSERVVITDFGLSRAMESDAGASDRIDGVTPEYVAPEQLEGEAETRATDIYSLGIVIYEMATGVTPFRGGTPTEIARRRLTETPMSPRELRRDLPAAWERAILRCLEREPGRRYGSAGELATALVGGRERSALSRRAWIGIAAAGTLAAGAVWQRWGSIWIAGEPPSLAVLPFRAQGDLGYLADGIADRLTDSLTAVPGLRVISRSASLRFRDGGQKVAEFGRRFRVRYVVSGGVRRDSRSLHVTTDIVEASTGFQVWGGTQDVEMDQVETIAQGLTRAVIHSLKLDARPAVLSEFDRRLTGSPEAYQAYLMGRYYGARRTREGLELSVAQLERAVQLDSKFAAAFAALGFSYFDLSTRDRQDWADPLGRALSAAQRALELDPKSADGHMVIACIKWRWEWDWPGAEQAFRKTLELNPRLALARRYYSQLLAWSGRSAEAVKEVDEAADMDPLNPSIQSLRATVRLYAGQTDEALELYQAVMRSDPAYENVYIPMSDALERKGRLADAIASCERGAALTKRASYAISSLGRLYGLAGRTREAKEILDELLARYASHQASPIEVAYVYMGLGDRDRTFEYLERGYVARSSNLLLLKVGPEFESLRGDARYAGLLRKLKL